MSSHSYSHSLCPCIWGNVTCRCESGGTVLLQNLIFLLCQVKRGFLFHSCHFCIDLRNSAMELYKENKRRKDTNLSEQTTQKHSECCLGIFICIYSAIDKLAAKFIHSYRLLICHKLSTSVYRLHRLFFLSFHVICTSKFIDNIICLLYTSRCV